ncbi:MAG TPA: ATP-grasp domain-containing protein [Vicinamibacterales bacterium]|nr:ATP-grasp domain-containing protein [Vicinamibacterales bacterium]
MHRVLVTAVGGNIGQGVVKALRAGSREYFIVGTDMEPRSAGFSFVDRACVTARAGADGMAAALAAIIEAERIEAIYVCSPQELAFFCAARGDLERATGARILVNPEPVVRVGQDKLETAKFLERHGFPHPETACGDDRPAVDRLIERCGFPVVAKPRAGWTSVNVFVIPSHAALDAARVLVPDLVVQQYLPEAEGEYTAGVVGSAADRAFAAIVLRRDLTQGTTYRTELVQDEALSAHVVAVAQALGVEGACNFQFRIVDGQPCVFEINPRFSGTSGIRYLYGFNDPEMVFASTCLGQPIVQPVLRSGVVMRYWNEIHLPGAAFRTIGDGLAAGYVIALPPPRGVGIAGR